MGEGGKDEGYITNLESSHGYAPAKQLDFDGELTDACGILPSCNVLKLDLRNQGQLRCSEGEFWDILLGWKRSTLT